MEKVIYKKYAHIITEDGINKLDNLLKNAPNQETTLPDARSWMKEVIYLKTQYDDIAKHLKRLEKIGEGQMIKIGMKQQQEKQLSIFDFNEKDLWK